MNNRQKELMHLLLARSNEYVLVQELANELECSEKTIRNDLNRLKNIFTSYSTLEFVRKPGVGVSLMISSAEKAQLFNSLYQTYGGWEHEQVIEITYHLLVSQKPVSLTSLAENYFTNKVTIKRHLDEIASWLEFYDLRLVSRQRVGHFVQGGELNKRNALARLSELGTTHMKQKVNVLQLFPENEINAVKKTLRDLQTQFSFSLDTGEFESLLIHALVMIKRTRQRSPVSIDYDTDAGRNVSMAGYHMTAWVLKRLEDILRLTFPESEHIYYTWHLESSRQNTRLSHVIKNGMTSQVVNTIVQKMEQMTMLGFHKDEVLIDGLNIHLESALTRLKYGLTIRNPLLEDIKKNYPYMFSMVIFAVRDTNNTFDMAIPEHETAYLVLHFQASVERMQKEKTNKKRAVIVCEHGVGMSHLLQAKLEQQYNNLDIIESVSRADVSNETYDVDLIISTTEIPEADSPVIKVSPLLDVNDKKRLNQWLYATDNVSRDTRKNRDVLNQLLCVDSRLLGMQQAHRMEVVEIMAEGLADKGYTNRAFIHSALMREKSSATAIGGGIAIPHAHPDLVNKSIVSAAVLPTPLAWGNEHVSVVFLLAVAKQDAHLIKPLMQAILSISQQPETIQQLQDARSLSDMLIALK